MPDPSLDKPSLRRRLRALRGAIDAPARVTAARSAAQQLPQLPRWDETATVAIYLPNDNELDTGDICAQARRDGKQLYLPVLAPGNRLEFALWRAGDVLHPNRYGIPEPDADAIRREANGLDLIFVPLVAWNEKGDRLGMGGGFYDRTLAGCDALKVGLGFELQRCESLVAQPWDVELDFVLTESALYSCAQRRANANRG